MTILRSLAADNSRGLYGESHSTLIATSDSPCCASSWEAAYSRFETNEQESRKFELRLERLGVARWSRDKEIAELFCGRGNGLRALERLGFRHVEGVDLSRSLVSQYRGSTTISVGDCRALRFADRSKDILIVQGGLHHLERLPEDLQRVLSEARRILRDQGYFVVVEPWLSPFLAGVHRLSASPLARRVVPKIDAFAEMVQHERYTYEEWLVRPQQILTLLEQNFEVEQCAFRWGKIFFVGRRR